MLKKIPLRLIPYEHKFEYLLSYREMARIRMLLDGFEPLSQEDEQWVEEMLDKYEKHFLKVHKINQLIAG